MPVTAAWTAQGMIIMNPGVNSKSEHDKICFIDVLLIEQWIGKYICIAEQFFLSS